MASADKYLAQILTEEIDIKVIVINESPRGDSLCHNDMIMTWTNVDDCAAIATCLVITLTHINYKLLVLYSICYRVYTRSQIIN